MRPTRKSSRPLTKCIRRSTISRNDPGAPFWLPLPACRWRETTSWRAILAAAEPAFSQWPPDTELGYSPAPGLRAGSAGRGTRAAWPPGKESMPPPCRDVCVERPTAPLLPEALRAALALAAGADPEARIESSTGAVTECPRGPLEFPRTAAVPEGNGPQAPSHVEGVREVRGARAIFDLGAGANRSAYDAGQRTHGFGHRAAHPSGSASNWTPFVFRPLRRRRPARWPRWRGTSRAVPCRPACPSCRDSWTSARNPPRATRSRCG